jgi:hypothetical protein
MTSETTQQPPMVAEPQKEHDWLQKLVGEWSFEREASMGPDKPREKSMGTEKVRSLGRLWIVGEGMGEVPGGGTHESILTLGYDPHKKRFVGTWVDSVMTYLWVYDGELDPAGQILTLNTEGPSITDDGTTAKYQETIEMVRDDHRIFRSRVLGDDGQWQEFLVSHYRRTG